MGYINQPRGKGDHPGRIATLARLKEGRDLLKSGAAGAKKAGGVGVETAFRCASPDDKRSRFFVTAAPQPGGKGGSRGFREAANAPLP